MANQEIKQARIELIEEIRKSIADTQSALSDFYDDVIWGAIESGHAGAWMDVQEYNTDSPANAVITEAEDPEHEKYKVDHDLIRKGLERIFGALNVPDVISSTGHRQREQTDVPFLSQFRRNRIIAAYVQDEAGVLDVVDYLAILEIALFGEVRYA